MKNIIYILLMLPIISFSQANTTGFKGQISYDFLHLTAYRENITYTPAVSQNVYTRILPTFTTSENDGFTFAGDTIKVLTAGDYLLFLEIAISGANGDDFRVKVFKNNSTTGVNGSNHITTTGTNNYVALSYHWYLLSLAVNDYLSFRITNTSNNNDPTISDIKFTLYKTPE